MIEKVVNHILTGGQVAVSWLNVLVKIQQAVITGLNTFLESLKLTEAK